MSDNSVHLLRIEKLRKEETQMKGVFYSIIIAHVGFQKFEKYIVYAR